MNIFKKKLNDTLKKSLEISFFTRSGLYYLESSPLFYAEQWIRFKKIQKPEQIISEEELLREVQKLITEDIKNFVDYKIPLSALNAENPFKHVKNLFKIYVDSIDVAYNKKFNNHKVFNESSRLEDDSLPDYYKRNFHNQTDGYLSKDSAQMYEHQVEILFRGTADMMRRLILPPVLSHFNKHDKLHILEVGAGTGISTKSISLLFNKAIINAYDLSEDYLQYARDNRRAENTTYSFGNGEDLKKENNSSADLWLSTFMFHELPHKARLNCLKEAYRTLKPGGMIALVDSIQSHDREDFQEILSAFPQNFHEPYYKDYTKNSLEKDFEDIGFTNIKTHHKFLSKVVYAFKK